MLDTSRYVFLGTLLRSNPQLTFTGITARLGLRGRSTTNRNQGGNHEATNKVVSFFRVATFRQPYS